MGICSKNERKNTDGPVLLCYYKSGNEAQKKYCAKLVAQIYDKNINYYIQHSDYLSIRFVLNGIDHIVKNDSDLSDSSIFIIINRIHNITTQTYNNAFYQQFPKNNNNYIKKYNSAYPLKPKKILNKNVEDLEKDILVDQLKKREKDFSPISDKDLKINKELENMCNLGIIMKHKIREEKKKNPYKYIEVKEGFGLHHMRERLQMLGGTLSYDGSDGFVIDAALPVRWGT